jgi:proline dehydrogenase
VSSPAAARDACQSGLQALDAIHREKLQSTLSVKPTQLGLDISEDLCRENLRTLAARAGEIADFVEVDMESSAYTDRTVDAIIDVHREHPAVGAVIQAYLYRSEADIRRLLQNGVSVRLCKGAYKEPEDRAFPRKADVDANYRKLMRLLLESGIYHRIATHDPLMLAATKEAAGELGLTADKFEFQMLYGVRSELQKQLVQEGWRMRVYVPFGTEWFAYFMRRLAERPANAWFALRSMLGG